MRALIVDDNPGLASSLRSALQEQGHCADIATTGAEAEDLAASDDYDIYILDVMLPDTEGFIVCRNIRRMGISKPILMLTALSQVEHRVIGLNHGADDYLTKPFHYEELIARVRALLRRGEATEAQRLTYPGIEIDLVRRAVQVGGEVVHFTAKEFALLELFMRNQDRVVSRTEISRAIWEVDYDDASSRIDTYVSNLRRKLRPGVEQDCIHTVIGTGYRFGDALKLV